MPINLIQKTVGPWPMNMYILIDETEKTSIIIDPGAEPDAILETVSNTRVEKILLTHGHLDHVGALDEIKLASGAPVYLHPAESTRFGLQYDVALNDGDQLMLGKNPIRAIHTPGHTPGMITFDIGENRMIVGDTVFVNGPGRTWSYADFLTQMKTMKNIVFKWPDETIFYAGHGPIGTIGTERPRYEAFLRKGWDEGTHGDIVWEKLD